jgi:glyoxylase-like metal-dependent hydrolase (beta-lactamase superfamily II)
MLENGKWVPTFPKARYLIGPAEYEFMTPVDDEEQQAMLGDSIKPIFDAGLIEMVEMDNVISPEIRLTPSIGHTPGHVSVMIAHAPKATQSAQAPRCGATAKRLLTDRLGY